MDRLNYFVPYESKGAHHEDSLTRALLVLLRHVPLVQAAFLDHVAEQLGASGGGPAVPPLTQMPHPAQVRTQLSRIPDTEGRLVSVLLTDERVPPITDIAWTDRPGAGGARYDGYLSFGDWIFLVEHKPRAGHVWREQLNPARGSVAANHDLELEPRAAVLVWSDLLRTLDGLLERRLLAGAEATLAEDFRAYVRETFPWLNPHPTLRSCQENPFLLERRCADLLRALAAPAALPVEAAPGRTHSVRLPAGGAVSQVYLHVRASGATVPDQIVLALYPGDTVAQARTMYSNPRLERAFRALDRDGWRIVPHLHFSFMSKQLHWARVAPPWRKYLAHWAGTRDEYGQVAVDDTFHPRLTEMVRQGLLDEEDRTELDRHFTATRRTTMNIIPGFALEHRWTLADAADRDQRGEFIGDVRERTTQALEACGMPGVLAPP